MLLCDLADAYSNIIFIRPAMSDNQSDTEDIILRDLTDDNLVQQMHDDLYDGLPDEIVEGVEILLERIP